jgi:probable F420-dependent oxidoreductase
VAQRVDVGHPEVVEPDADTARDIARRHLATYLALPNYRGHLLRSSLREVDLDGGGSDRLVDALVAWGGADAVQARIAEFERAGADHACVQVLTAEPDRIPLTPWRALAAYLG